MNEQIKKTRHCGIGPLATTVTRIPAFQSLCGTVTTGGQIVAGRAGDTWHQRDRQWRYFTSTEVDGSQRMEESQQSRSRCTRTHGARVTYSNSARLTTRLQSLCLHTLSTKLRSKKNPSGSRQFSHYRFHGARRETRTPADRSQTSQLATHKEGRTSSRHGTNGIPIRGRSTKNRSTSSRHGTKSKTKNAEIADFVPPWDKTPVFGLRIVPVWVTFIELTIYSEIYGATR